MFLHLMGLLILGRAAVLGRTGRERGCDQHQDAAGEKPFKKRLHRENILTTKRIIDAIGVYLSPF